MVQLKFLEFTAGFSGKHYIYRGGQGLHRRNQIWQLRKSLRHHHKEFA